MYDGQYMVPKGDGVFLTQSDITAPFYTTPNAMFTTANTSYGNIIHEVDKNGIVQYGSVYGNTPPTGVNQSTILNIFTRASEFVLYNSTPIGPGIRTIPITANAAQSGSNGGEDVAITIFDNNWNVQYST